LPAQRESSNFSLLFLALFFAAASVGEKSFKKVIWRANEDKTMENERT